MMFDKKDNAKCIVLAIVVTAVVVSILVLV